MSVKTFYFEGVINQNTYLNHELGSKFFFLSSFAYKFIGFLKKIIKNEQELNFFQLFVWNSTLPMNLKSVLVYIVQ